MQLLSENSKSKINSYIKYTQNQLKSNSNPNHLKPESNSNINQTQTPNHEYLQSIL